MAVGALIETLDLSMAILASFFCIFAVIELGGVYSWLIYAVTGILSILLTPQSLGGWFYLLFFGFYPILKEKLEKLKRPLAWVLKLLLFHLALLLGMLLAYFFVFSGQEARSVLDIFRIFFGIEGGGTLIMIGIYLLTVAVFVAYDIALTRLISFYLYKLRHRLRFFK